MHIYIQIYLLFECINYIYKLVNIGLTWYEFVIWKISLDDRQNRITKFIHIMKLMHFRMGWMSSFSRAQNSHSAYNFSDVFLMNVSETCHFSTVQNTFVFFTETDIPIQREWLLKMNGENACRQTKTPDKWMLA